MKKNKNEKIKALRKKLKTYAVHITKLEVDIEGLEKRMEQMENLINCSSSVDY